MNLQAVAGQKVVGADPLAHALGHRDGAVTSGIGQHDRKFIAAEPRDHVGFTRAAADDAGRFDERPAAAQMAVACR